MCYTPKDRDLEEEARRLRAQEEQRTHIPPREADVRSERHEHKEEKPLTEKVKEVVGVR